MAFRSLAPLLGLTLFLAACKLDAVTADHPVFGADAAAVPEALATNYWRRGKDKSEPDLYLQFTRIDEADFVAQFARKAEVDRVQFIPLAGNWWIAQSERLNDNAFGSDQRGYTVMRITEGEVAFLSGDSRPENATTAWAELAAARGLTLSDGFVLGGAVSAATVRGFMNDLRATLEDADLAVFTAVDALPAEVQAAAGETAVSKLVFETPEDNWLGHPDRETQILRYMRALDARKTPWANYFLALAHLEGWGVAPDPAAARSHARKAVNGGVVAAKEVLARLALRGAGERRDPQKAARLLGETFETTTAGGKTLRVGNPRAMVTLSRLYESGHGVPKDKEKAWTLLEHAAQNGLPAARFEVGRRLLLDPQRRDDEQAAGWLKEAAAAGHAKAQSLRCWMSAAGRAEALKPDELTRCYRAAALDGHAWAQWQYGERLVAGTGVEADRKGGMAWVRRAADQGLPEAKERLAALESGAAPQDADAVPPRPDLHDRDELSRTAATSGAGEETDPATLERAAWEAYNAKDYGRAFMLFERAARAGLPSAQTTLGTLYESGLGTDKDEAAAVAWYRRAAEQGNAAAQNNLAVMLLEGRGTARDVDAAVDWFGESARNGNKYGQFNLGLRYLLGDGLPESPAAAADWFRMAAEQDNPRAQYHLGLLYKDGRGVARDPARAVKWFRKAAKRGDADAQFEIARAFKIGSGLPRDHQQAVEWSRRAAEQGHAQAQHWMYLFHELGRGVPDDLDAGLSWLRKSAAQGYAPAQFELGMAYVTGRGVARDPEQAALWFKRAADAGSERAADALRKLRGSGAGTAALPPKARAYAAEHGDQGFHVCNMRGPAVEFSFAMDAIEKWLATGWRRLASGECFTVLDVPLADTTYILSLLEDRPGGLHPLRYGPANAPAGATPLNLGLCVPTAGYKELLPKAPEARCKAGWRKMPFTLQVAGGQVGKGYVLTLE